MNTINKYQQTTINGISSYFNNFIQNKTFLKVNIPKTLEGIQNEFKDTNILILFIQSFWNFNPSHLKPSNMFEMIENANDIIKCSKSMGLQVTCSAESICQPEQSTSSQLLSLLWQLIQFELRKTMNVKEHDDTVMIWVNSHLKTQKITNYTIDLQDGRVFVELLNVLGIECGNSLEDVIKCAETIGCQCISVESIQDCVEEMNVAFLLSLMKWKKVKDLKEKQKQWEMQQIQLYEQKKNERLELEQQWKEMIDSQNGTIETKSERETKEKIANLKKLLEQQNKFSDLTNSTLVRNTKNLRENTKQTKKEIENKYDETSRKRNEYVEEVKITTDQTKEYQKLMKQQNDLQRQYYRQEERKQSQVNNANKLAEEKLEREGQLTKEIVDNELKLKEQQKEMVEKEGDLKRLQRQNKLKELKINDIDEEIQNENEKIKEEDKTQKRLQHEKERIEKQILKMENETKVVKTETDRIQQERKMNENNLNEKIDEYDELSKQLNEKEIENENLSIELHDEKDKLKDQEHRNKIELEQITQQLQYEQNRLKDQNEFEIQQMEKEHQRQLKERKEKRKEEECLRQQNEDHRLEIKIEEAELQRKKEKHEMVKKDIEYEEIKTQASEMTTEEIVDEIIKKRRRMNKMKRKNGNCEKDDQQLGGIQNIPDLSVEELNEMNEIMKEMKKKRRKNEKENQTKQTKRKSKKECK